MRGARSSTDQIGARLRLISHLPRLVRGLLHFPRR